MFRLLTEWAMLLAAATGLGCAGTAAASVISPTATLPLLGVPYVASSSAGCFPTAGVCVSSGDFTLTSVVSSVFNPADQDIVADFVYQGTLTSLMHVPIGPVSLSGSLEQEVLGRTTSTETGSWTTDLLALSASGPLQGHTLTLTLSPNQTSSGTTSIAAFGGGPADGFVISSFFDVFVTLTLDTTVPLTIDLGPTQVVATTAAPEPAGLAVLVVGLLMLPAVRRHRAAMGRG
jgi:hypothetical protein